MVTQRRPTAPRGPFSLSTNDVQFTSHWETATGDSYLGTNHLIDLYFFMNNMSSFGQEERIGSRHTLDRMSDLRSSQIKLKHGSAE